MGLQDAKKYLRQNWEKGVTCPCCGQHVQLYRYKLFMTSAVALIYLYRLSLQYPQKEYFHVSEFAERSEEKIRSPHFAELRFWDLVIPMNKKTGESNASGKWKITSKGKEFVKRQIQVPKYIKIYNNKFVGFDGDDISISDALGNKFDYSEIIGNDEPTAQERLF